MRHLAACAAFLFIAVAGLTGADFGWVGADTPKNCTLDPITGDLKCVIVLVSNSPLTVDVGAGSGEGAQLPLRWSRTATDCSAGLGCPVTPCVRLNGAATEVGVVYLVMLINYETRELLYLRPICVFPGDPLPQPPLPPPSAPEFRLAAAELLKVDSSLNPRPAIGGLTGLETWVWCTDPGVVPVVVTLRGWTAAAEMTSVEYEWDISGTTSASRTATSCGTERAPAATWMPETKGPHQVAVSATWAGTWTLTWNGIPMGTFVLGPFEIEGAPQSYPVAEYVGVLTDGRGG